MDRIRFLLMNRRLLTALQATPAFLKEKKPEILTKLQAQGQQIAQSTGNKVTEQEAAFAGVLESNGFIFLPKQKKNDHLSALPNDGIYYIYQANGSQASIDFQTLLIEGTVIKAAVSYDLKHTTSKQFYLNDGWFQKDVIYIVTWSPKKSDVKAFIGLGQDIPTEAELTFMTALQALKKNTNDTNKKVDSLRPYVRFANQYSCEKFTDDYTRDCFEKVTAFLS